MANDTPIQPPASAGALTLFHVPPATLKPAGYNPRTMSPAARERLRRGIEAFGLVDPLVVRRADHLILGGHQRHAVAMELNLPTVPVVYVDVNDAQAKALNVLLNNPHAQGQWDADRLAEILRELEESELDATLTGFDDTQIAQWLEGSDLSDTPPEDGEGDDVRMADVRVQVGEYSWTVERGRYQSWVEELRQSAGFMPEAVQKALEKRLGL